MAITSQVELITDVVHLSIDVQNIFTRGGIWETPWMERVPPGIEEIAARHPARWNLFLRSGGLSLQEKSSTSRRIKRGTQHSSPSWGMNCERCGDCSGSRSRDRRSCSPAVHDSGLPADG
jgi:hypothetical protein